MKDTAGRAFVEHIAMRVSDLDWYRDFLEDVFGMRVWNVSGDPENPDQIWVGGFQLTRSDADVKADPETAAAWHVGVLTDDPDGTLERIYSYPEVHSLSAGKEWCALPNGVVLEIIRAPGDSAERVVDALPRK